MKSDIVVRAVRFPEAVARRPGADLGGVTGGGHGASLSLVHSFPRRKVWLRGHLGWGGERAGEVCLLETHSLPESPRKWVLLRAWDGLGPKLITCWSWVSAQSHVWELTEDHHADRCRDLAIDKGSGTGGHPPTGASAPQIQMEQVLD